MIVSFTIPTKDIFGPVQNFRKLTRRSVRKETGLEIKCFSNTVTFSVPGASVKRACISDGMGAFSVSLEYFFLLLRDHKKDLLEVTLKDGELKVGNAIVSGVSLVTKIEHPENVEPVDLTFNYTDVDLLQLPPKHNGAIIDNAHVGKLIKEAQDRLENRIDRAYTVLKTYGVEKSDLQKIVDYRLGFRNYLPH